MNFDLFCFSKFISNWFSNLFKKLSGNRFNTGFKIRFKIFIKISFKVCYIDIVWKPSLKLTSNFVPNFIWIKTYDQKLWLFYNSVIFLFDSIVFLISLYLTGADHFLPGLDFIMCQRSWPYFLCFDQNAKLRMLCPKKFHL